MKKLTLISLGLLFFASCVPIKKYQDLQEAEKKCSEELAGYKNAAIDNEGIAKNLQAKYAVLLSDIQAIKADTADLGSKYRNLQAIYDQVVLQNMEFERRLDIEKSTGAKETSVLQADLDSKTIELRRKEEVLKSLEAELVMKQNLLAERERRVNELEEIIRRKDDAVKTLQAKVANALRSYENKGLTVVEKDGKIYVSLEAKLLFKSGSTVVENDGKPAIVQLAKVLEKESDLEIIVEGHTDTDVLRSPTHPKTNWELSVLRATSVVEIMLVNSNMNPASVMAAGRSEYVPVDKNDKAKNRRIEIIIYPNLNELFKLISK